MVASLTGREPLSVTVSLGCPLVALSVSQWVGSCWVAVAVFFAWSCHLAFVGSRMPPLFDVATSPIIGASYCMALSICKAGD